MFVAVQCVTEHHVLKDGSCLTCYWALYPGRSNLNIHQCEIF